MIESWPIGAVVVASALVTASMMTAVSAGESVAANWIRFSTDPHESPLERRDLVHEGLWFTATKFPNASVVCLQLVDPLRHRIGGPETWLMIEGDTLAKVREFRSGREFAKNQSTYGKGVKGIRTCVLPEPDSIRNRPDTRCEATCGRAPGFSE